MTKRKTFTKEFKLEAVRLLESGEQDGVALARELGVRRNQLYKWQKELQENGANAFRGEAEGLPPKKMKWPSCGEKMLVCRRRMKS
ncbi:MAG: transposase [Candidatus Sedimenticola sp. 6PFRAG5]